jgi:hypothetical protein
MDRGPFQHGGLLYNGRRFSLDILIELSQHGKQDWLDWNFLDLKELLEILLPSNQSCAKEACMSRKTIVLIAIPILLLASVAPVQAQAQVQKPTKPVSEPKPKLLPDLVVVSIDFKDYKTYTGANGVKSASGSELASRTISGLAIASPRAAKWPINSAGCWEINGLSSAAVWISKTPSRNPKKTTTRWPERSDR